jgi:hypothetical protein
MGSLDGVGGLGLGGLGAVPFCWEHSLKTDWAWIALYWIALDGIRYGHHFNSVFRFIISLE